MSLFTLSPWRKSSVTERRGNGEAVSSLQHEMNRVFDQFNRDFGLTPFESGALAGCSPSVNVSDTDKEILVTAELPGVEEKDVDVSIDRGVLTIKGEKRAES